MLAKVIYLPLARPAVRRACEWHEAVESVTRSNIKIACAWQRMLFRFWWGV